MTTESVWGTQDHDLVEYPHQGGSRHTSSRMLENYLTDLEYLVRERMWQEALPLALSLPHLCVALSDTGLRSSREKFVEWCQQWLHPMYPESFSPAPTGEDLFALSRERAGFDELDTSAGVPISALKRLRLRRLARPAPPRRSVGPAELPLDTAEEPEHNVCAYIMLAVNRWYDEWASFDATVQTNLARLAVLR